MRSRAWCFTINNYTDEDIVMCMAMAEKARYIVMGFEKGDEGTPHIQGYVYFDNQRSRPGVSKMVPRARLVPSNGTLEQNKKYCSKEGDIYEVGEPPSPGVLGRERIEEIMENPWANFQKFYQYRKAYAELVNREWEDHERFLYTVSRNEMLHYAKAHVRSGYSVSMPPYDYDGEEVIFMHIYTDFQRIVNWKHGLKPKYSVGYERRYWNPRVVFLVWDSPEELNDIEKTYRGLIDEVKEEESDDENL